MKNRFKVIDLYPRGFCKGVFNAIELAKEARLAFPHEKISILGELVHNSEVSSVLKSLNIVTIKTNDKKRIDLLDEIDEGIIIFSAHGISPLVEAKAHAKGLKIINASCEDVLVTQDLIKSYLHQGYNILYIGQKKHPEAEAILELDSDRVQLVETDKPIPSLESDKIFVTNQTTMSIFDIHNTLNLIKSIYPNAVFSDETCSATRLRQEAILKCSDRIDGIIIIGDKNSNNTKMLSKIAANRSIKTILQIQKLSELDETCLDHCNEIAITAGASTPKFIIDEVVNYVKAYAEDPSVNKKDFLIKPFI